MKLIVTEGNWPWWLIESGRTNDGTTPIPPAPPDDETTDVVALRPMDTQVGPAPAPDPTSPSVAPVAPARPSPMPLPARLRRPLAPAAPTGATRLPGIDAARGAALAAMAPVLPTLALPVEVLNGTADVITEEMRHAEAVAALVPGASVTARPGVGLMPDQADPDAVEAAILRAAMPAGA